MSQDILPFKRCGVKYVCIPFALAIGLEQNTLKSAKNFYDMLQEQLD